MDNKQRSGGRSGIIIRVSKLGPFSEPAVAPPGLALPAGSWAATAASRRSMLANKGRDTKPEVALRSALHAAGLRFRKHYKPMKGVRCEIDVAFTRSRLAVFVDGCFWHGCPDHATRPARNAEWWAAKLDANERRDRRTDTVLSEHGWRVLRIWEHETVSSAVSRIQTVLVESEGGNTMRYPAHRSPDELAGPPVGV